MKTTTVQRSLNLLAALAALAFAAMPLRASQEFTVQWDPSADATVIGYKVYLATSDSTNVIDAGRTTLCTLTNLAEATTYQFCVTAYDGLGVESDPSNTLQYTVPLGRIVSTVTRNGQGMISINMLVEAVAGQRVALQSSTNFTDWTTIATSDVDQPLSYAISGSPGEPKRFYRSVNVP